MDTETLGKEAQKILELVRNLETAEGWEKIQIMGDLARQCQASGPRLAREYIILTTGVAS